MFSSTTHIVLMDPFIKNMIDAVQNNKTLDIISIIVTTFNTAYAHQQYTSPITSVLQTDCEDQLLPDNVKKIHNKLRVL